MLPEIIQNNVGHKAVSTSTVGNCIFPSLSNNKILRHFSTGCDVYTTERYDYVIKIILLGDQGVGKTSFMRALKMHPELVKVQTKCRSSNVDDHLDVEVTTSNGQKTLVKLCDTGGQERYRSLTSSYYRGAHGVLLMFNVVSPKSLEHMELWLSDLDTFVSTSSCARILVGTNCTSAQRTVSSGVGRGYAESRDLPYIEIDSSHFYNIIESLTQIVEHVIKDVTSASTISCAIIRPSLRQEASATSSNFMCLC